MIDAIVTLWIIGVLFGAGAMLVALVGTVRRAVRRRQDWIAEGNVRW